MGDLPSQAEAREMIEVLAAWLEALPETKTDSSNPLKEKTMSISPTMPGIESLTLVVTQEIHVRASLETTFATLLEQMGPENDTPDRTPFPMTLEPWPGGRWFRDLGQGNGHLWGHVQAIKRPTLLEITGPLFMSYAVVSNMQYRLSEVNGGTLIKFHHKTLGVIQEDHRAGMVRGWSHLLTRIRERAEAGSK
jgi:Activator of Hsp90 ATPase homolog 1-like protein